MLSDLRIALRGLRRAPVYAAAALLCVALGVGANSAVFAVVDGVLRRPLPYPDPERLVAVWERRLDGSSERNVVAPADLLDWRAGATAFEGLAATFDRAFALSGDGEPEELRGQWVTADLFAVLGARPALGRAITAADG